VKSGEYRISVVRQHSKFLLDEQPIKWQDEVWLRWHADDGFMLEKYNEQDENLIQLPPEEVGETDQLAIDAAAAAGEAPPAEAGAGAADAETSETDGTAP
jgi:hypothetical protein